MAGFTTLAGLLPARIASSRFRGLLARTGVAWGCAGLARSRLGTLLRVGAALSTWPVLPTRASLAVGPVLPTGAVLVSGPGLLVATGSAGTLPTGAAALLRAPRWWRITTVRAPLGRVPALTVRIPWISRIPGIGGTTWGALGTALSVRAGLPLRVVRPPRPVLHASSLA